MDKLRAMLTYLSCGSCFSSRSKKAKNPAKVGTKSPLSIASGDSNDVGHRKTTVVISHGAFQTQVHYQPYIDALQQSPHNIRAIVPQQSSAGRSPPRDCFPADVKTLHEAMRSELAEGRDVLLVCHSYGGIPGCEALIDLPTSTEWARRAGSGSGCVLGIVFVAAFVVEAGQSLITSKEAGEHAPWLRIEGPLCSMANPAETLFSATSPPALVDKLVAGLVPHSGAAFAATTSSQIWESTPSCYVRCNKDRTMLPEEQDYFIKRLVDGCAADAKVLEIASDHAPFVSMPARLAEMTMDLVGDLRA